MYKIWVTIANYFHLQQLWSTKMMNYEKYIIVQAGGRGSRLGYLTRNRPKCLIPIINKPMIFHLFAQFPESKFIIIGDAHFDVLKKYLSLYANVDYSLVCATGNIGTLAGIRQAVSMVPTQMPFMIIWSDLVLPEDVRLPLAENNLIVTSPGLSCRWKFEHGKIVEETSDQHGICGFFLFKDTNQFGEFPEGGQLVKFFSCFSNMFSEYVLPSIREFGLLETYEKLEKPKCRPFNKITFLTDRIIKQPLDSQGAELIQKEVAWYKEARHKLLPVPQIFSYEPLIMERLKRCTIADLSIESLTKQKKIITDIITGLKKIHASGQRKVDIPSYWDTYLKKTVSRLCYVQNLVPFINDRKIKINGQDCRNVLFYQDELRQMLEAYVPTNFNFIHGDPTFSNIFLDDRKGIIFIDPRGYFGHVCLYGDKAYDYAKLYYSLFGSYDKFNQKKFLVDIEKDCVSLKIEPNGWSISEDFYFDLIPTNISRAAIHLFHALIWLSLTTYVWEDYDAICAAFYNGTKLFEEALNEHCF